MKKALCLFMLFFTFIFVSQTAKAEEGVYGLSGMGFTDNTVVVGSLTAMTYGVAFHYDAIHEMIAFQDNTPILDEIWLAEGGANLEIYYEFFSNPGSIYTHFSIHGLRIFWQIPCGRYDAFGFSLLYGDFGANFFFGGLPWRCIAPIVLTVAGTVVQAQAQQQRVCNEQCIPCQNMRRAQKGTCKTVGVVCVAGALGVLSTQIGNCNGQPFCQVGTPTFNQQQCDNCKDTAYRTAAIVGIGGCGGAFLICRSSLPDCTGLESCPGGPFQPGDTTSCTNP